MEKPTKHCSAIFGGVEKVTMQFCLQNEKLFIDKSRSGARINYEILLRK